MAATGPNKARVLVTRKMMPDVERRIAELFHATLNPDDHPVSAGEVLSQAAEYDAILLTSFEKFGPDFVHSLPASIRIMPLRSHSLARSPLLVQAKLRRSKSCSMCCTG